MKQNSNIITGRDGCDEWLNITARDTPLIKPSMLVVYDYEMPPWQERIKYSMPFLMVEALKEYFDVYTLKEKNETEVDCVFNTLPLGKEQRFFRKGKFTMFWNCVPLEGPLYEQTDKCDLVFCAVPAMTSRYGDRGITLLQGVNPYYNYVPCEFEYDVGFLGSEREASRINMLNELEKHCKLLRGSTTLGEETSKLLSKARLVLSIEDYFDREIGIEHRFFTFGNIRPILMFHTLDFERVGFKEGVHYIGYHGTPDLLLKVDYYLVHMDEAEQIGKNLQTLFAEKHTYHDRAKKVYDAYLGFNTRG